MIKEKSEYWNGDCQNGRVRKNSSFSFKIERCCFNCTHIRSVHFTLILIVDNFFVNKYQLLKLVNFSQNSICRVPNFSEWVVFLYSGLKNGLSILFRQKNNRFAVKLTAFLLFLIYDYETTKSQEPPSPPSMKTRKSNTQNWIVKQDTLGPQNLLTNRSLYHFISF